MEDNKISKKFFNNREELQKKINDALSQRKKNYLKNVDQLKKEFNLGPVAQSNKFNDLVRSQKTRNKNNFLNNTTGINEIKDLTKSISQFFENDCSAYMALGGLGDLLLVLAVAYDQPKPKILFLANQPNNLIIKDFCSFFQVPCLVHKNLMGTHWCNIIYEKFIQMPCFKESAHLAENCNYGDWFNSEKYRPRIRTETNWGEFVGTNRLFKEKYVIFCPSGSWKGESRRRYLSLEEYRTVIGKLLEKKYKIVTTSSETDLKSYGLFPNQNCYWMTNQYVYSYDGTKKQITFRDFLQYLNSSDLNVSMDTYLKTLMLLLGKESIVVRTRFNGIYKYDESDASDKIFLDPILWPKLKLTTVEELIELLDQY